jgi:hypothetical protein
VQFLVLNCKVREIGESRLGMAAHISNSSYLGRKGSKFEASLGKSESPYLKNKLKVTGLGMWLKLQSPKFNVSTTRKRKREGGRERERARQRQRERKEGRKGGREDGWREDGEGEWGGGRKGRKVKK